MKRYIIVGVSLSGLFWQAEAAERDSVSVSTDTLQSVQLKEITVEEAPMAQELTKSVYTPTRQQRNASTDGVSLLYAMAVPRLDINPVEGSVSLGGAPVAFFIDGVPASAADITDMNTRDVRRVEILDYPSDPRFRNENHVVNFIMQKYEYGGYTKLGTTDMFVSCIASDNTVNSKMVYKKMTYDARAYYQYGNYKHYGSESTETFRGLEEAGGEEISREQLIDDSRARVHNANGSFRARYQTDNTVFSSTASYIYSRIPLNYSVGHMEAIPIADDVQSWSKTRNSLSNNIVWDNDLFQILPAQWYLSGRLGLSYLHSRRTQVFNEGTTQIRDVNIGENTFDLTGSVNVSKDFSRELSLGVYAGFHHSQSRLRYEGSENSRTRQNTWGMTPGLSVSYRHGDSFLASAKAGAQVEHNGSGTSGRTTASPNVLVGFNFMPDDKNWFALSLSYSLKTPQPYELNPNVLPENPWLFTGGNADLRSPGVALGRLYYSWTPKRTLNFSAELMHTRTSNLIAQDYSLTPDGAAIVGRYDNCGNFNDTQLGAYLTVYALGRKLILNAGATAQFQNFSGLYSQHRCRLQAKGYAAYYWKTFSATLAYTSPSKGFDGSDPLLMRTRSRYSLGLTWGTSAWTIRATLTNPFRRHWRGSSYELDTPLYSKAGHTITVNSHCRVNLSVTYIIGYGKKVRRGEDISAPEHTQSAVE